MKYVLVLLAVLAAASASEVPDFGKGPLHDDLKEFAKLFPATEVKQVLKQYAAQDAEFQEFYKLLKVEFKELLKEVEAIPEVIDFFNYLHKNGIDVYKYINILNKRLGLDSLVPSPYDTFDQYDITGGLAGLLHDLKALIPIKQYAALFRQKMAESAAFRDLMNYVRTPEFRSIGTKIYASAHFQTLLQKIKNAGIDLQAAKQLLRVIFGTPATLIDFDDTYKSLQDEFDDFAALIDVNKVVAIVSDYLANDAEVQEALAFARSPEFHNLVYEVEASNEYQTLVIYLYKAGMVDIFKHIEQVHSFLGMKKYEPPVVPPYDMFDSMTLAANRGIAGMVADIKAILPLKEIKALYEKKLKESKVFADFVAQISSPNMQKIIDNLYKNETYVKMLKVAKSKGLDIEALDNLINSMLGLKFPKPSSY